jgi:hypothetical protein
MPPPNHPTYIIPVDYIEKHRLKHGKKHNKKLTFNSPNPEKQKKIEN